MFDTGRIAGETVLGVRLRGDGLLEGPPGVGARVPVVEACGVLRINVIF